MAGSFLEDPGDLEPAERSSGAAEGAAAPSGRGESADGTIRVSVGGDGRIERVLLAPDLLRRGPEGSALDSETLGTEIAVAVNAALDDLAKNLRASAGDALGDLENELDHVTSGFNSAIDQVAKDIEQARKRLET